MGAKADGSRRGCAGPRVSLQCTQGIGQEASTNSESAPTVAIGVRSPRAESQTAETKKSGTRWL